MPNLAIVEGIASHTLPRTVVLSGMTATVLFTCLDAANRLYDWQGVGYDLTPTEIDTIQSILAEARHELMSGIVGQVIAWSGNIAPENCLLCDGSTFSREDYPNLYAKINAVYIVDSDHFNVPDLRSRFVLGSPSLVAIGVTGGEENHTLTEAEMPSHSHTVELTTGIAGVAPGEVVFDVTVPILTDNTGNTGGGGSHNNMPPFLQLAYYIVAR